MKQNMSSLLKKFTGTKEINDIPDSRGIYLIADCPLTKTDPSRWECVFLKKGADEKLKSKIKDIVISNGLARGYKSLTYYFAAELSRENASRLLSEIAQVHILDIS